MKRGTSKAVTETQAPDAGNDALLASLAESSDCCWFHNTGDQPAYVLLNSDLASASVYDFIVAAGASQELTLDGRITVSSFSAWWASGSEGYKARYWPTTQVTS